MKQMFISTKIPLTRGQEALVDGADFAWLSQWKWQAHFDPALKSFVAVRTDYSNGKALIFMHRFILGLEKGDPRKADHVKAGDTLDNRRSNLRIATNSQSAMNRRHRKTSGSPFKGVHFHKQSGKWRARIMKEGKRLSLGLFETPHQAHSAYCEASLKYHGEFANFGHY